MTQWHFVLAAYSLVVVATLALIAQSFVAMRRADMAVEESKGER